MTKNDGVYIKNLRERREAFDLLQNELAAMIPTAQPHLSRVESCTSPTSIGLATTCASIVGHVTLQKGDTVYVLATLDEWEERGRPGASSNGAHPEPVTAAIIAQKEMQDYLEATQRLANHVMCILRGSESGTEYMAELAKEAIEASESGMHLAQVIKQHHPEAYRRAMEMVRAAKEAHTTSVA